MDGSSAEIAGVRRRLLGFGLLCFLFHKCVKPLKDGGHLGAGGGLLGAQINRSAFIGAGDQSFGIRPDHRSFGIA